MGLLANNEKQRYLFLHVVSKADDSEAVAILIFHLELLAALISNTSTAMPVFSIQNSDVRRRILTLWPPRLPRPSTSALRSHYQGACS